MEASTVFASVKEVIEEKCLDLSLVRSIAQTVADKLGKQVEIFAPILIDLGVPCSGVCCACRNTSVVDTFTTCSSCKKSLHGQCAIQGKCNMKCGGV